MRCITSKRVKKHRHCEISNNNNPPVSKRRSFAMNVYHPPEKKGDTYHVVALTSSTLDSIKLEIPKSYDHMECVGKGNEFIIEMIEAKAWSEMIDEKIIQVIPKTPVRTPPGEPEMINVNELMAGLEEDTSLLKSFSFHVSTDHSSFRKTLEELSPSHPFYIKPAKRVVLYFTSLRGVRKTYEDCCYVRVTLKSVKVRVDERDVSMHLGFKQELEKLVGEGGVNLPKVFVGERCIGGVEDIRELDEHGKLEKVFEGCEMVDDEVIEVCEGCGDVRFVPCLTCSGSCKMYYECEDEEAEEEEDECEFQRCPDCNENGLVRCPLCCY